MISPYRFRIKTCATFCTRCLWRRAAGGLEPGQLLRSKRRTDPGEAWHRAFSVLSVLRADGAFAFGPRSQDLMPAAGLHWQLGLGLGLEFLQKQPLGVLRVSQAQDFPQNEAQ